MTETAQSSPPADDEDVHTRFIGAINFRYQKLYSNVTLVILGVWLALCTVVLIVFGFGWPAAALCVGSLLLALFALRAVVHTRGRGLQALVEEHMKAHDQTLAAMLEKANASSPSADFFVSLMDGPLARQRRLREQPPESPQ